MEIPDRVYKHSHKYGSYSTNSKSWHDVDDYFSQYKQETKQDKSSKQPQSPKINKLIFYFKITKIKIWTIVQDNPIEVKKEEDEEDKDQIEQNPTPKTYINGIEVFYYDISTGKNWSQGKKCGTIQTNLKEHELVLGANEYIIDFYMKLNTDSIPVNLGFKTSKGNIFRVGDDDGIEINNNLMGGDYIVLFTYGSFDQYLQAFGVGVIDKKVYLRYLYYGYFRLRHIYKNNEAFRKKWKDNFEKLSESNKILIKIMALPDTQFHQIIKYCLN